jgi:hypothetical protein
MGVIKALERESDGKKCATVFKQKGVVAFGTQNAITSG